MGIGQKRSALSGEIISRDHRPVVLYGGPRNGDKHLVLEKELDEFAADHGLEKLPGMKTASRREQLCLGAKHAFCLTTFVREAPTNLILAMEERMRPHAHNVANKILELVA